MREKIIFTLKRGWGRTACLMRRAAARLRGVLSDRERMAKLGYYAALAALLVILGSASYAYRSRRETVTDANAEEPKAVIAMPAPSPEPTAEPVEWVWPLEGEIVGEYSAEAPVWSSVLEQWQTHPGLDIAGAPGEAVYACRDGTVLDAWSDRLWGNVIVVQHEDGFQSTYAGLNTLQLVTPGDSVRAGEVISAVGESAACESDAGWHLHFELARNGAPVSFEALISGGKF